MDITICIFFSVSGRKNRSKWLKDFFRTIGFHLIWRLLSNEGQFSNCIDRNYYYNNPEFNTSLNQTIKGR